LNTELSEKTSVRFVEIESEAVGQRLDNFLLKAFKNVPKSRIYRIIRKGEVRVNRKRAKAEYKLVLGDQIRIPPIRIDNEESRVSSIPDRVKQLVESSILVNNKNFIVINKPSGLAVHSGSGIEYGVIDVMRSLYPDRNMELVHRLDRDTSGCLMIASGRQALVQMQKALQENQIRKSYVALVHGRWPDNLRDIKHPLRKFTLENGERRVRVDPEGQKSHTRITTLEHFNDCSRLNIELLTGRTHQIRVHCQQSAHEVIGDNKYGNKEVSRKFKHKGSKRLFLHASCLEFPDVSFMADQVINAPVPDEFEQLITHR
jgi:23S rRNA pseudouridine955/2504/2580 synthase